MLNLPSNALKFTPAGGLVALTLTCHEVWARIAVRDSGVGIAQEHISRRSLSVTGRRDASRGLIQRHRPVPGALDG